MSAHQALMYTNVWRQAYIHTCAIVVTLGTLVVALWTCYGTL